ncbi:hypothetical protein D3C73_789340 [compost metagenome]
MIGRYDRKPASHGFFDGIGDTLLITRSVLPARQAKEVGLLQMLGNLIVRKSAHKINKRIKTKLFT